jgi:2'-5' RNA ligase
MRLFIAFELPKGLLNVLGEIQDELRARMPERAVRWTKPEAIHLTLKFLGEVDDEHVTEIETALARASDGLEAFTLDAEGLGCFPNVKKPRVLWVGVGGNSNSLNAAWEAVEQEVAPLGFPTDDRGFHPHLTLGRVGRHTSKRDASAVGKVIGRANLKNIGSWHADAICLVKSDLQPTGAVYTILKRFPIGSD